MALNKCENCEAMVSSKFENCPNCGSKLNVVAMASAIDSDAAPEQEGACDKKKGRKGIFAYFFTIAIVIAIISAIINWIF